VGWWWKKRRARRADKQEGDVHALDRDDDPRGVCRATSTATPIHVTSSSPKVSR